MANGNRLRPAADDQVTATREAVLSSQTYQTLVAYLNDEGYTPVEDDITVHTTGNEFIASLPLDGGGDETTATITIELVGDAVIGGTATVDVAGHHGQSGPTTFYKVTEDFDVYHYTVGDAAEE